MRWRNFRAVGGFSCQIGARIPITSVAGTVSLEAPIVALRTAVSAPAAEPLHRLLSEDLQPLLVDVGDAHASHLARHGCHLWPSRQGYFGRERPPPGGVAQM